MAIEKTINVNVEAQQANEAVKGLKQQFREAQQEVIKLSEAYGATSKEAIDAAKRAAELKDKIEDTNDAIQAFKGEGAFLATGKALQSVASGFSAVEGAMGLFGAESKQVQETLLKVQSAMALSQGLAGLEDAGRAFNQVKAVAVNAFNTIKGAIGATGIGLLVIALGTLYANWDKISKAVTDSFPAFKNIGRLFDKIKEVAYGVGTAIVNYIVSPFKAIGKLMQGDLKGALNELKDGFNVVKNYEKGAAKERQDQADEYARKRLEKLVKQKDDEIAVAKAAGKDTFDMELANLRAKQKLNKDNAEELEKLRQEERVLVAGHNKALADKHAEYNKALQQKQKEAAEKERQARAQKLAEEKEHQRKLFEAARSTYEELEKLKVEADKRVADLGKSDTELQLQALDEKYGAQIAKMKQAGIDTTSVEIMYANDVNDVKLKAQQQQYADEKALSEARKQIAEAEKKAKIETAMSVVDALANVASLAGEQTAASKGLAIAGTLISTYSSAQKAYESAFLPVPNMSSPILGAIYAAGAVAVGIKNLQAITSVQVPGASGGGGGVSASAGGAVAPRFNIVGQNANNQLAQTIAGKQAQPVKAYVVSGEVTTGQSLERNRIQTATFN